jgi:predicted HTH domain antitoxin
MGLISQGKAAELAGLSRADFVYSLARFNFSPFQVTADELAEELERE